MKNFALTKDVSKGTSRKVSEISATNRLVKISVLAVLAFIIMLFEVVVPLFPGFLKMDLSDVPALLGAFALGPIAGVIIELIKNLLHIVIRGTHTAGIGELSNFILGAIFVFTAGSIYFIKKDKKHAVIGMIVATIMMSIAGILTNYYMIIPFYTKAMGWPLDTIIEMGTMANPRIIDLKTMIIYGVTPFNILKGVVISVVVTLIYKKLTPILHK
jgi:riboflavin transporter FmnP